MLSAYGRAILLVSELFLPFILLALNLPSIVQMIYGRCQNYKDMRRSTPEIAKTNE